VDGERAMKFLTTTAAATFSRSFFVCCAPVNLHNLETVTEAAEVKEERRKEEGLPCSHADANSFFFSRQQRNRLPMAALCSSLPVCV